MFVKVFDRGTKANPELFLQLRATRREMADTTPTLSISTEKVCFIVVKAREFDVKDVLTDPDDGSNATDDGMVEVLEDHPDDPVVQELTSFIAAMSEDEQVDLVTLAWLGRGDGDPEIDGRVGAPEPVRSMTAERDDVVRPHHERIVGHPAVIECHGIAAGGAHAHRVPGFLDLVALGVARQEAVDDLRPALGVGP